MPKMPGKGRGLAMVLAAALGTASVFAQPPPALPAVASLRPVPHGELRIIWYDSPTYAAQRRMHVYLPPGYESSEERYPVLYLTHGQGQDDAAWSDGQQLPLILDNLIAEGRAVPMIVVMPTSGGADPALALKADTQTARDLLNVPLPPARLAARTAAAVAARDRFLTELERTIIPLVDARFRTRRDRLDRAIAGASYGGSEALRAATRDEDQFAWAGIFGMGLMGGSAALANPISGSGTPDTPDEFVRREEGFFADSGATNRRMRLIWIGVGKNDIIVRDAPDRLARTLSAHGIANQFHRTDGGHDARSWATYVGEFASLLFR